jgi:cytochrome c556
LVLLRIKDADYNYKYLDVSSDISRTVQPGDEVITPGYSEGGGVMLNNSGKVLGIGPVRIEFDNPISNGNSGGPVFQPKSGKVLGVVTEAMEVDTSDDLDKASFVSRNSAMGDSMRHFGLRMDTVSTWLPLDFNRFQAESAFLDRFDKRTRALDCYLNAPNDGRPEDKIWQKDDTIMKANANFSDQASGADASQLMDATRILYSELVDVANLDVDAIQSPGNYYSFDQQRAKEELAYRQALKTELDTIGNTVSRMSSLPRSNH